jgi:hypothetical protein
MLDLDAQEVEYLNVKLGGKKINVRYPTFDELTKYEEDYSNKELDKTDTLKEFLKVLGLKEDSFKLLNGRKLSLLIQELTGVKK